MKHFPRPGTSADDDAKGSTGRTLARMLVLSIGVSLAVGAVAAGALAALAAAVWLSL